MKPQLTIAIDPDVDKSGIGIVAIDTNGVIAAHYTSEELPEIAERVKAEIDSRPGLPYKVYVEAGWLNQGNYHLNPRDTKAVAAAKGRQAGRNHQVGLDIIALLRHVGIKAEEARPLIKCWKGKDRKITHDELDAILRNGHAGGMLRGRSNQEERDALLLAWEKSGLPIKC